MSEMIEVFITIVMETIIWVFASYAVIVALLIMLIGTAIIYFLLRSTIGAEPSFLFGLTVSAFPAYWVFKKLEIDESR